MSSDHDFDDGLVHGHAWARSEQPRNHAPAASHRPRREQLEGRRFHHVERAEPDHDDGLVHDHHWARSERISGYAAE